MRRFYTKDISGPFARIEGEEARHIYKVLRLQPGQEVILCDGSGTEYLCRLTAAGPVCEFDVLSAKVSAAEPKAQITLFQALPKADKLEHILQKCTELGVSGFVPFSSEYAVMRADDKKLPRWERILLEASKQSGRACLPRLSAIQTFAETLPQFARQDAVLFFNERETARPLSPALLQGAKNVGIVVGPEGGFSPAEADAMMAAGAHSVTLGPRILRTETAGPVAAALTLYLLGEMQ